VSLTWTAQPANPTVAIKGQDVSLTWHYALNAKEQTKSQTNFLAKFKKCNESSSQCVEIASYLKISGFNPTYSEQAPHIVVDRATGTSFASIQINDVRIDDEGIYEIEISFQFGVVATDHEAILTVSGTFNVQEMNDLLHYCHQLISEHYVNIGNKL